MLELSNLELEYRVQNSYVVTATSTNVLYSILKPVCLTIYVWGAFKQTFVMQTLLSKKSYVLAAVSDFLNISKNYVFTFNKIYCLSVNILNVYRKTTYIVKCKHYKLLNLINSKGLALRNWVNYCSNMSTVSNIASSTMCNVTVTLWQQEIIW